MRQVVDLQHALDEVGPGRFLITAAHNGHANVQRSFRVMALSEKHSFGLLRRSWNCSNASLGEVTAGAALSAGMCQRLASSRTIRSRRTCAGRKPCRRAASRRSPG